MMYPSSPSSSNPLETVTLSPTVKYLDKMLRIDYRVTDSANNEANAQGFLIVKDRRKP